MNRRVAGLLLLLSVILVPVAAQQPASDLNPKKAIAQARAAMQAGKLQEALELYDAVATSSSKDAARYRSEALYGAALVRLSSDESVADEARARAALNELNTTTPTVEHPYELSIFIQLLDSAAQRLEKEKRASVEALAAKDTELAGYKKSLADVTAKLATVRAEGDGGKAEADKLRQEVSGLRYETRNLRDQLAKTQAELEKKDAALRKVAGSLVKSSQR